MATVCSFLQLRFPRDQNFSPTCPSRSLSLSSPSRFSLPLTFASLRPPSPSPISAKSEKPITWIEEGGSNGSIDSIVNPSLQYANVLFFRSAYNVQVIVDEGEPEEALLRRFRREVSKAGVIQECKRRKFFENKQEEKKRKAREAGKRNRRRRWGPRVPSSTSGDDAAAAKKSGEDDDNWDMPEGALPY